MFLGSIVALITPMDVAGDIDYQALEDLIHWHIKAKTQALVINGTTGESATLNFEEKLKILNFAIKVADNKIPIIAGTGSCATYQTINETKAAFECGINACLVVTPYYNRPTQEGLYQHYKSIAQNVSGPIITYNVPTRTGVDLFPETMQRLANIPNIVGIKEATGDVSRVATYKKLVGDRFLLLSGDDSSCFEFIQQGGQGVISVCANVVPDLMQQMCALALMQNYTQAKELNDKLFPLYKALMIETFTSS